MTIRRKALYGWYGFFKALGYWRLVNAMENHANIVMFHRVNDYDTDPLTTPTHIFEEFVRVIRDQYQPMYLNAMVQRLKTNQRLEPRMVAITFDDGYRDNFSLAAPILKKYGVPATFFVTSGYIGTERVFPWDENQHATHPLMNWDEVRALRDQGFAIGAHTVNHVDLGSVPLETAREEIVGSRETIERELGHKVPAFAFPFGGRRNIRNDTRHLVQEAGFEYCCAGYGGKLTHRSALYDLPRIPMYQNVTEMLMEIDNFMTYFDGKMTIKVLPRVSVKPVAVLLQAGGLGGW